MNIELDHLLQSVPAFVLVLTRLGAMMIFAPFLGSGRIPRRVRVMMALALAAALTPNVPLPVAVPDELWLLSVAMMGELLFGLAMGMVMAFVFTAAQWAGEIIGQQMGFNISEVFDPQFGQAGSLMGDLYFMLTLTIFLLMHGHHAMLIGINQSFVHLPLMSVKVDPSLLALMTGLLTASTELAFRLAAPLLVTMLVVDLILGFVGKTMPQFNVLSAGMSMRSLIGLVVVIAALSITSETIHDALLDAMYTVIEAWKGNYV